MIYIVKCISKFSKTENLLFEKLAGMMDRKGDQIRVIDLLKKGGRLNVSSVSYLKVLEFRSPLNETVGEENRSRESW